VQSKNKLKKKKKEISRPGMGVLVIPITWEDGNKKITVQGQPGEKESKTQSQSISQAW
jgi:hypothetical protein